jgi:hypothetical protein
MEKINSLAQDGGNVKSRSTSTSDLCQYDVEDSDTENYTTAIADSEVVAETIDDNNDDGNTERRKRTRDNESELDTVEDDSAA